MSDPVLPGGDHPWVQQEGEGPEAYQAFRLYMLAGTRRTLKKVCEELGKPNSMSMLGQWSSKFSWRERCRAFDSYVLTAEVDGFAGQMASVRSRHMRLTDELLDKLETNLRMLKAGADPSIRWTTAFQAAVKAHHAALTLREDKGAEGVLEKIMSRLEELEAE